MSTKRWIPTMLRARSAAEDAAAQRLATARRDRDTALDAARSEDERLERMSTIGDETSQAFLAAAATRGAAAATHAAATYRAQFAERRVLTGVQELNLAAQQRRTVEKLTERLATEVHSNELAIAQRELDDVAITRFGRDREEAS
jgi:hypothetical protein